MLWCCAAETEVATVVTVPTVSAWDADAASQAEVEQAAVEQAAVEQAAAVDSPDIETPVASPAVPAPPPKAEEPQALQEFNASLVRVNEKSPFGWAIDMLNPGALYIESLGSYASTAADRYNESAPAGEDIRPGDYITRVNGASGSAQQLGELLTASSQPQVTIQRPSAYVASLSKGDKPLGVDLNFTTKGRSLYIVGVREGAVREQAPEVSQGHRILRVNGHAAPPKDMIEALKGSTLKIDILRAPVV